MRCTMPRYNRRAASPCVASTSSLLHRIVLPPGHRVLWRIIPADPRTSPRLHPTGTTQLSIVFPDWVDGGEVLADFGPNFQGVQKCWGQISEVRETWGSIDGGVKKKLLAFRLGIHPQTLVEGREGAPPDEDVQVGCTISGDIPDHDLTAQRTASHITYPGSTCASHISPPPPSPPPAESDEEAEALAETLRQRDGNWGACDEEDFR